MVSVHPTKKVLTTPLGVTVRDKLLLPPGAEAMGVTFPPSEEVVRSGLEWTLN